MILRPFLLLAPLLCLSHSLAAADYSTPSGRVQDLTERILTIIDDTPQDRNFRWSRMAALVYDGFDFRSMSQGMMSSEWRRANEDERRKYTEFFSQYLEAAYFTVADTLISHTELVDDELAIVHTYNQADERELQVRYKLKNNNGNWFAYDVVIDGISLIENYHQTHSAITINEGMHGLTTDIQRRINKFKVGTGKISGEI